MKILKFLISVLTLIICVFLSYVCYRITQSFETSGIVSISLMITIPIFIIFTILLGGLLVSTIFSFISCTTSTSILIRVLSIIFLILTIALAFVDTYFIVGILKQFKK